MPRRTDDAPDEEPEDAEEQVDDQITFDETPPTPARLKVHAVGSLTIGRDHLDAGQDGEMPATAELLEAFRIGRAEPR